ncbi:MAG: hypothetical protein ACLPWG_00055 [Steroidobacteraceae bacterium]
MNPLHYAGIVNHRLQFTAGCERLLPGKHFYELKYRFWGRNATFDLGNRAERWREKMFTNERG